MFFSDLRFEGNPLVYLVLFFVIIVRRDRLKKKFGASIYQPIYWPGKLGAFPVATLLNHLSKPSRKTCSTQFAFIFVVVCLSKWLSVCMPVCHYILCLPQSFHCIPSVFCFFALCLASLCLSIFQCLSVCLPVCLCLSEHP